MKILYCGIDVYLPVFEYLADSEEHEIVALHTYHEENEYIRDEKIVAAAKRRGIPATLERPSPAYLAALFQSGGCDLLLSAEYDRKLPVLELAQYRGVNLHNSLLPEGRGYFPVEMRLYKGYDYGGVTIHKLAEEIDRGDVLLQERFSIAPEECSLDVYEKSARVALRLTKRLLADFPRYWTAAQPQDETKAVWWPLPTEKELTITPDMRVAEMHHIFRSFSYLTRLQLNGRRYAVTRMECIDDAGRAYPALPNLERTTAREIVFRARDGVVKAECRLEAEGNHEMEE